MDVISGRPRTSDWDVPGTSDRDDQIGSSGDVLGRLEGGRPRNVLGTNICRLRYYLLELSIFFMFLLKKNMKYFSSMHLLRKKVCLCGGNFVEIAFLWYLENDLLYWPQMWQYKFWIVEEATSKLSTPEYCPLISLLSSASLTHSIPMHGKHDKGTLMQIWKSPYMLVLIQKQYPENFAFLIFRSLDLFTCEVGNFLKKLGNF